MNSIMIKTNKEIVSNILLIPIWFTNCNRFQEIAETAVKKKEKIKKLQKSVMRMPWSMIWAVLEKKTTTAAYLQSELPVPEKKKKQKQKNYHISSVRIKFSRRRKQQQQHIFSQN